MSTFDKPQSLAINKARLDHLASLNLPLAKRSVLEVGAGVGKLTPFWEKQKCAVISTDGRAENVAAIRAGHVRRKAYVADLNVPGSHAQFGAFDIVFCYGVLYHVADPARVLSDLADVTTGLLLLETLVWHTDDGGIHPVAENRALCDQSLDGLACRPARDWLWDSLGQLFRYVYMPLTQPDHPDCPLHWPAPDGGNVRAVFVASRQKLTNPALSGKFLVDYARHSV